MYIDEILRPLLLHLINEHAGVVFQQDNARPHIVKISRTFLQQAEVESLSGPARSSDLNPIEHMWDIMGRRLRRFPQQANRRRSVVTYSKFGIRYLTKKSIIILFGACPSELGNVLLTMVTR
jgi:hypothetical protein